MSAVAYKDPDLFEIRFLPSGYLSDQSRDIIRKELIDANGGKRNRHNTITGSSNYQSDGHAKITSLIGMPHIVMSVLSNTSNEKNMVSNSIELQRLNTQLDMIMAAGASGVVQQMETIRQMVANIDVAPTTSQPAIDVSKNIENPPLPSQEKKSQAVLDSLDVKPVDSAPQPKQQEADQVLKPIVSEVKNPSPTIAPQNSDAEVSSSPSDKQEAKPEALKSNDAKVSTNQPDVLEIKSNVSPIEVAASQPSSTQVDKGIETARIDTSAQPKQQVTTRPENLNANVLDARVTKVDVSTQKSDMGQKFSEPVKSSVAPVNKSTVSQPALQQPSQSNFATALKAAAVIPITPLAQTQFYQTRSTVVVQSQIPQTSTPQMKGVTSPATPYIQPQVTTSVASVVVNQSPIQPKAQAQPQAVIQTSSPQKQEIRQETPPVVIQVQKPKVEIVKTAVIPQSSVASPINPKTAHKEPPKTEPVQKGQEPVNHVIPNQPDNTPRITVPEKKIIITELQKAEVVERIKIVPDVHTSAGFKKPEVTKHQLQEEKLDIKLRIPTHEWIPEYKKPEPIVVKPIEPRKIEPTVQPHLELKDFMPKGSPCGICTGEKGCCTPYNQAAQAKTKEASLKSAAKINAAPPTNFVP